jgi:MFS family permease
MKTYLVYGFGMTLASSVLTLALYFLGYHSDAAKLGSAQWIITAGSFAICIVGIVLGTKARRAELPAHENFTYGRALGAGVMITLFAALLGVVTNYLYFAVINPGLTDLIVQVQVEKLEAKGVASAQIEQVEKIVRAMSRPPIQAAFGFLGGMFFGTVISLVTSAFLQRPARDEFAGSGTPPIDIAPLL